VKCSVLHEGEGSRPARRRGVLGNGVADPDLRSVVHGRQLFQREGLPDATAKLCRHDFELRGQPVGSYGVTRRRLEAAVAVLPLSPCDVDHYRHGRRTYPLRSAANRRPRGIYLGEDPLTQLIARTGERERHVGVQALQAPGPGVRTANAEVELWSQLSLLGVRALQTRRQPGILGCGSGPAFDSAGRLESGYGGDELGTREPERRRERLAPVVERVLLRDRWMSERTPDDHASEGARGPA